MTATVNVTGAPVKGVSEETLVIEIELAVREAPQAVASALASTEPRPVTWSYPTPALKPYWNGAVAGQSVVPLVQGTMLFPVVTS